MIDTWDNQHQLVGAFPKYLRGRKVFDFVTFKRELGVSSSVNYSFVTDPLPFKGITPICLCYIRRTFWNCLSSLNTFNLLGRYWFSLLLKWENLKTQQSEPLTTQPALTSPWPRTWWQSSGPREDTDTTRGLPGFQVGEAHHTGFLQVCVLDGKGLVGVTGGTRGDRAHSWVSWGSSLATWPLAL